ncbi:MULTISPECIES: ribosomal protein S18-alanine N-acetyltransferase [Dictyoglomus]|jgi:ribosomal-protein-alanine N-acetyltransferase|uniref:Ribosomal-protein-alanine acetyltransferase n=1 Tax=Dictyoglomus turgidum (strain DSM 6724 / Z-1310) TaxID=515635 RepID=B8E1B5_DICTD|nr:MULTISPECIES: ribosomal protein S18-alanine N-acetyltransferase [Dictyoglomus]ACK42243.1 ribosomal-protein-alanine acetyltransferase [Dictyoglomus turgidum DSM 6724]PNV80558.1 MAG: ribosomal-protein-alanine N-acetyltransferase [Dictyoglomus turgidum]HBU32474.1 ribosomal-protein-alanine N-acetyltransferase [Dictyoglomus sp.]
MQDQKESNELSVEIRPMKFEDIDQVDEINKLSFSNPWSRESFERELSSNRIAHYFVAIHENKIIGFVGLWIIFQEAQITTIAVHPNYRGRKVGEKLLDFIIDYCQKNLVKNIILEVRVSNTIAQNLYYKKGFKKVGVRKWYYKDGEDALVMVKKLTL